MDYVLGCDKKFSRAQAHLETLRTMVSSYLDNSRDGWRAEAGPGSWKFAPRDLDMEAEWNRWSDWSVVAGDVVHNLRSSIEHLAGALVQANGGRPDDKTTFPVWRFRRTDGRGAHALPNVVPDPPGVDLGARQVLDHVQPYTLADRWPMHPLWWLHAMWNQDKHRLLLLSIPGLTNTYSAHDGNQDFWQVSGDLEPIESGDDYIRFRLVPDWDAGMSGEATLEVAFGPGTPGEGQPLVRTLAHLSDFVRDSIIEPLRPFIRTAG